MHGQGVRRLVGRVVPQEILLENMWYKDLKEFLLSFYLEPVEYVIGIHVGEDALVQVRAVARGIPLWWAGGQKLRWAGGQVARWACSQVLRRPGGHVSRRAPI